MAPVLSPDSSQDPSPRMAPTNTYNFTSPLSPAHLPSPHRYDFDYGVQSSLHSSNLQHWDGNNNDQQLFSAGSTDTNLYPNNFNNYGAFDTYGNYDTSDLSTPMTGLSTTPPSSTFAANGLPFRGLDFIRNYNSGYVTGDQDSLWQSYDPGAFGYDPDIPFTLGDTHHDPRDAVHH